MEPGIFAQIDLLSQNKGIDPEIILEAVKDAMLAAARKYYKTDEELVAEINPATGSIDVYAVKTVTDLVADPSTEVSLAQARREDPQAQLGAEIRYRKSTRQLGRISAQMAKQVIFQKIREAERETICAEFENRINTVEYCTVKRMEGQDLIVELGRTEARMPRREQSRLESYMPGDRVRVIIKSIEKSGRGPAIIASRASEELVKRLFEQEVPEIYDDTVAIRACAREAGERTKIAVQSRDRDVDAVGACVGMKGMRVQTIIRELRGEKIDIIQFLEDPIEMVRWALSPAKVSRVEVLDRMERHMEVIVDESQLSLAIGKKGQNVRLAAKLLGWRIDIKSEEEKRQEVEDALAVIRGDGTPVSSLLDYGLSVGLIDKLVKSGTPTLEKLSELTPEQLQEIPGVGSELVERIRIAVNQCYAHLARTVGAVPATDETEADQPAESDIDEDPGEKKAAVPAVLPGVPDDDTEAEDDEEIDFDEAELEGFGKMNRYRGPDEEFSFPVGGGELRNPASDAAPVAVGAVEERTAEEKNDSNQ